LRKKELSKEEKFHQDKKKRIGAATGEKLNGTWFMVVSFGQ